MYYATSIQSNDGLMGVINCATGGTIVLTWSLFTFKLIPPVGKYAESK